MNRDENAINTERTTRSYQVALEPIPAPEPAAVLTQTQLAAPTTTTPPPSTAKTDSE